MPYHICLHPRLLWEEILLSVAVSPEKLAEGLKAMEHHPCSHLPDMPRTDRGQPMSTLERPRTVLEEVETQALHGNGRMDPVTAALELQPIIRKHLDTGEQAARLANEVFAAVGQVGLFRLFAPREVGGLEAAPTVALAAIEAVSAADPAVGWRIGNSQPACLAAGWLAEDDRAQLFAEPNRNFGFSASPAGRAVPENDGYRLSG